MTYDDERKINRGKRIAAIRKETGMNQTDFALAIGLKKSGLQKLEYGENTPAATTAMLICQKFNINHDWLMDGVGDMYIAEKSVLTGALRDAYTNDRLFREIADVYLSLDDNDKAVIANVVQRFVDAHNSGETTAGTSIGDIMSPSLSDILDRINDTENDA